jgi:hypothetical protein
MGRWTSRAYLRTASRTRALGIFLAGRSSVLLATVLLLFAAGPVSSQFIFGQPGYSAAPLTTFCGVGAASCPGEALELYEAVPAVVTVQFTAANQLCSNVQVAVSLEGTPLGTSAILSPGQSMSPIAAGTISSGYHSVSFSPTFQAAGCNSGSAFVFGTATISYQPVVGAVPAPSSLSLLLLGVSLTAFWSFARVLGHRTWRQRETG